MGNPVLDDIDEERAALVPEADPAEAYVADPVIAAEPALVAPRPALQAHGAPVAPLGIPGYSERADQGALDAAVRDRSAKDAEAHFADAGAFFRHAFNGAPGNGDAIRKTRDDSFQDVMRQRATEDRDRVLAKEQHSAALEAALARGDSPESVKVKDSFGGTTVGAALRQRMGEESWARLPGSAIPGAKEQLASETELMKSQLRAQGAAKGSDKGDYLEAFARAKSGDPAEQEAIRKRYEGLSPDAVQKIVLPATTNLGNQAHADAAASMTRTEAERVRQEQVRQKLAEDREKGVAKIGELLGKDTADLFFAGQPEAEEILKKYEGKPSLPGAGFSRMLNNLPFLGDALASDDAIRLHKTMGSMQQGTQHLITGANMSPQEREEFKINGIDWRTARGVREGYEQTKRVFMKVLERVFSGDPRVAQEFVAQHPDYGIPGHPRFSPEAAKLAHAEYSRQDPLANLRPPVVEYRPQSSSGTPDIDLDPATPAPNGAPPIPAARPVRGPGGAPEPLGVKSREDLSAFKQGPQGKGKPSPADAAALQWLASPEGKKSPERAGVIRRLQAKGLL